MLHTYATVTNILTLMFSIKTIISTAKATVTPVSLIMSFGVSLRLRFAYMPVQNRNVKYAIIDTVMKMTEKGVVASYYIYEYQVVNELEVFDFPLFLIYH